MTSETTAMSARRQFCTVDGRRISYLEWGNADLPPLILLHDVKGPALAMEWAGVALSANYHVLAPDQICRGHSDWANLSWGQFGVEEIGGRIGHTFAMIGTLIEENNLGPTILAGGSTGGTAAALYGAHHPENVAAMIIDDGAMLRLDNKPDPAILKAMGPIVDGEPQFDSMEEGLATAGSGTCTSTDPRSLDPGWLTRRAEELLVHEGGKWQTRPPRPSDAKAAELEPDGMRVANEAEVRSIRRPTLVFHNARRSHWVDATVEEIRKLNPEWIRVVSVPAPEDSQSPLIITSAPRIWLMYVQEFLSDLSNRSTGR